MQEEIMKELSFQHMIKKGLKDVRENKVISNNEMQRRIQTWQKQGGSLKY